MTRKVFLILLALVLAVSAGLVACGAETGQEEEEEELVPEGCIEFNDLGNGTQYNIGDTINTSGATITLEQFPGASGYAEVGSQTLAGGSGKELLLKGVNGRFDFGGTCQILRLLFHTSGGGLYLEVHNASATVTDFSDVVSPFGDDIQVRVRKLVNGTGMLKLSGNISRNSVAIGGQDLAIDNVCILDTAESTIDCCHFEDASTGTYYIGDSFIDSGVIITVDRFQGDDGTWCDAVVPPYCGYARVQNTTSMVGRGGNEVFVSNASLRFDFPDYSFTDVSLRYCKYDGNINIEINGNLTNVENFSDLVSPIKGAYVNAGNFGNGTGVIGLSGNISSLAVGGQEMWIDAVCRVYPTGPSAQTYDLTIYSSNGGSVPTPGEPGPFPYSPGTVVNLVATPEPGWYFIGWNVDVGTIPDVVDPTTTITMDSDKTIRADFWFGRRLGFQVAAYEHHTVGLKSDGTVVATGYNSAGQCNVESWTDIIQVAAGSGHTVGLCSDWTVVATGNNTYGQCAVDTWTDIVQIAAGPYHTVGLKSDYTVVATGFDDYGQLNVNNWTDIIQIAAGVAHTVGLKSDGTVIGVGCAGGACDQLNFTGWTGIKQIAAGWAHTVGLRSDGTVVAAVLGAMDYGQGNVSSWTDIIQIAAGGAHTVGLKSDGTVVAEGGDNSIGNLNVDNWTDIIQVAAGLEHTVGLSSDGTVVAVGRNTSGSGQCNVGSWDLIP
jgi:hypothetical protein